MNYNSVSAVMFVYNEAEYIHEQIDSILRQTIVPDKIIIVDDQSTDNTKAVIDGYIVTYGNLIEYYYNPQKGKVNALAMGLDLVKTQYYFICAGDDVLADHYIATNLAILAQYPEFPFVYNANIAIYEPYYHVELPQQQPRISKADFKRLLNGNIVQGYIFANSKILKDILPLNVKLEFEDWYLALKLASKYTYCIKNEVPTFIYRKSRAVDLIKNRHSRKRFYDLQERNIRLFKLLKEDPTFNETERAQFENKILFVENLIRYSPLKALRILFISQFYLKEKIKALIYPVIKYAKYRA